MSYQGGDLSSALLNFNEGKSLDKKGLDYLYIYGANNHNENNISKNYLEDRIQWVKNNYIKIINLDKNLILSAENKYIFTAFCLNMKKLYNNPDTIIKTPVFLDATCSGIQHLAGIMQDLELGTHVNLTPYKNKDKPDDIYSQIVTPINEAINNYGYDNNNYFNLQNLKFTRKILKQSIMTKVYNVSQYGIAKQLENNLENVELIKNNIQNELKLSKSFKKEKMYKAPTIYGDQVLLTEKDLFKISQIINEQIFVLYPSLNKIYTYFINISKLMVKLNLPLTWITPAGMKITQHYLKSKKTLIPLKFGRKTKKLVLREWTEKSDNNKQIQAIIPNIIHSLDANHLINIVNTCSYLEHKIDVITIHDCFGTHPNDMEILEYNVRKEFILLYTHENFLEKFHNRFLQSIKDNNVDIFRDHELNKEFIEIQNINIFIPDLPKLGE